MPQARPPAPLQCQRLKPTQLRAGHRVLPIQSLRLSSQISKQVSDCLWDIALSDFISAMMAAADQFAALSQKLGGAPAVKEFFAAYGTDGFAPSQKKDPQKAILDQTSASIDKANKLLAAQDVDTTIKVLSSTYYGSAIDHRRIVRVASSVSPWRRRGLVPAT
jgi:hypothetical protein